MRGELLKGGELWNRESSGTECFCSLPATTPTCARRGPRNGVPVAFGCRGCLLLRRTLSLDLLVCNSSWHSVCSMNCAGNAASQAAPSFTRRQRCWTKSKVCRGTRRLWRCTTSATCPMCVFASAAFDLAAQDPVHVAQGLLDWNASCRQRSSMCIPRGLNAR